MGRDVEWVRDVLSKKGYECGYFGKVEGDLGSGNDGEKGKVLVF